ncbi:aldo/keto reductase [Paenibacillus flagellatus]|uniref:Aldo/keto reductase n=1 Tax=Paenibacillus flagellatus TaxID=2211139 RepID=A0A2V5K5K6_9BACL|nr:aldo/keto reductase [Paenibacillus flagellatus]PYI53174.1 aldo/keto reductase [Paenibacillus flagellatus]
MKYIDIAGAGMPCSKLVLGTDYYKPDIMDKIGPILDAFTDMGGNAIDTAHIYGGGNSERALGLWMESRNNRDRVLILTKGAHHNRDGPRVTAAHIAQDLEESLERLRTDYIDLYALHRDDPTQPVGGIVEALNAHIDAGRIRAIGASNWTHQRLQEANEYAAAHGLVGFSFSSPNLSLAKPNEPRWEGCVSADEAACDWHERVQMPLLSWSSQAGGFFSGRFSPEKTDDKEAVRVYYSDANWERLRRSRELAERKGATPIQIACAYVLCQPFPACALVGPQSPEELRSSAAALAIELSRDELEWLDLRSDRAPL